ncbi:99cc0578-e913-427d-8dd1-33c8b3f9c4d3 [Thermothielavioides terrestris]|uniref:99cc0578-e913-427d-8dd1-33c8b3f9c4d3 n=1 Tax=Thermothielavioides terrestris TaxID=2587410 RepID=A0A446BQA8_9PEZI|nr:99cc0578-e913-427d-8dd1-33c8b3f9c4d3 [Thermothielavioides terrestris]
MDAGNPAYRGNCHCGRYRFELAVPKIEGAISCACSLCRKKGYIWLPFTPASSENGQFKVVRDDGFLREYQSAALRDKFCSHCGTGVLGEHVVGPLKGQMLVNVRTVQGVNPFELEPLLKTVSLPDPEQPLPISALPRAAPEAPTAHHTGSCHCGKVRLELLTPIEDQEVKEDNCSSCDAYVGVYPTKSQVRIHGREHTFEYLYGRRFIGFAHCETCGVIVFLNVYGPPLSAYDHLPPERRERALAIHHTNMTLLPLNVRTLDVDLAALRVKRSDEGTKGYVLDP